MTYTLHAYFLPEHRDHPATARTAEEANALIDDLLTQDYDTSMATMVIAEQRTQDEHIAELSIGVDPERGIGSVGYSNPDGAWYAHGQASSYPEVLYCYFGNEREFPPDSELPIEALRKIVVAFLSEGGTRPDIADWRSISAPQAEE